MIHDPTDERYRKPRRLRNTELQKFIRNATLATTSLFALAMYIAYKKDIAPYVDPGRSKEDFGMENPDILVDYGSNFCKSVYDKLMKVWKKEAVSEATKDNIQTDK